MKRAADTAHESQVGSTDNTSLSNLSLSFYKTIVNRWARRPEITAKKLSQLVEGLKITPPHPSHRL